MYLPVGIGGSSLLLLKVPRLSELMGEGTGAFTSWTFYRDALVVSSVLYFGSVLAGFVIVMTVPRLLNLAASDPTRSTACTASTTGSIGGSCV